MSRLYTPTSADMQIEQDVSHWVIVTVSLYVGCGSIISTSHPRNWMKKKTFDFFPLSFRRNENTQRYVMFVIMQPVSEICLIKYTHKSKWNFNGFMWILICKSEHFWVFFCLFLARARNDIIASPLRYHLNAFAYMLIISMACRIQCKQPYMSVAPSKSTHQTQTQTSYTYWFDWGLNRANPFSNRCGASIDVQFFCVRLWESQYFACRGDIQTWISSVWTLSISKMKFLTSAIILLAFFFYQGTYWFTFRVRITLTSAQGRKCTSILSVYHFIFTWVIWVLSLCHFQR